MASRASRSIRAVAVLALVAAAPAASAQDTAPLDPGAPPAPAAIAPPAAPPGRSVRFVATTGYDYGLEKLLEVRFEGGSTQSLRLNGGSTLAVGAAFWPLRQGRFETRATLGVKYDSIEARNGSARFIAFPLEITESVNVRPLRLAAGASILLGPRLRGSGFLNDADLDLKSSLGLVGQAEYVLEFKGGSGSLSLGLRYLWQRLEAKGGGGAHDASAIGGVLGVTL